MAPLLKLFTKPGTRCQIIEWLALELYLMQRAAGMPIEGAAVRP